MGLLKSSTEQMFMFPFVCEKPLLNSNEEKENVISKFVNSLLTPNDCTMVFL